MADYTLLLRDPRTLALLGEMPRYRYARFTRRAVEQGEFQITVRRQSVAASLIARNVIVEARRDGAFEFAGVIRGRRYDAINDEWELAGPCLKWWLQGRQVIPPAGLEYDAVSAVVAETAMKGYVSRHLTAPTDAARDVDSELSGVTFTTAADQARGAAVSFNGRYVNLLTGCLAPLATAGGLWHDVRFQPDYAGYSYDVYPWVNATRATGAVPVVFSTGWGNVSELRYVEDYLAHVNAVYVLGQGEGAARTVREVTDSASVTADFRRETSIDSRNNDTAARLDQDGQVVLSQHADAARRLDAQPLTVGPTLYRDAWDLGHDVTVALPEEGIELNRRIVEVEIALDESQGEIIRVALGASERTLARVISEALQRTKRVQAQ